MFQIFKCILVAIVILAICIYIILGCAKREISAKNIPLATVSAIYLTGSIVWMLSFINLAWYITLMPIYPLLIMVVMKRVKTNNKEENNA